MGACLGEPVARRGQLGLLDERLRPEPVGEVGDAGVEPRAVGVALASSAVGGGEGVRQLQARRGVRLRGGREAGEPRAGAVARGRNRRLDQRDRLGGRGRGPIARRDDDAVRPAVAVHAQLALGHLGAHAGLQPAPRAVDLDPRLGQADPAHRALHGLVERLGGGLRGGLDLARARHALVLAPARRERERAAVLTECCVEGVQRSPHTDSHAFGLAHRRATLLPAAGSKTGGNGYVPAGAGVVHRARDSKGGDLCTSRYWIRSATRSS
jgi:hypothetical protein